MSTYKATFGGGCFWCMEQPFAEVAGVIEVLPGYMGGSSENPSYEEVCSGETGHVEVVQVIYSDEEDYHKLLDIFWRNIDPTTDSGQFVDKGSQYRPVIFYHGSYQKDLANISKQKLEGSKIFSKPIVVAIEAAQDFYIAEQYHCRYYQKNPKSYNQYKELSGRAGFLKKIWDLNPS